MTVRSGKNEPQFLSGWKEIASYLGKGVRTVQRYERQFGLPVRRPAGKAWGSVIATKAELDGWVTASPIREAFRLSATMPDGNSGCAADIKRGLAKMMELRDQMLALRAEVRQSVESLRNSVYELQGKLDQSRYRDSAATWSMDAEDRPDEFPVARSWIY